MIVAPAIADASPAALAPSAAPRADRSDFEERLGTVLDNAAGGPTQDEILREAASQLVATAFIMPLVQSMHESPWAQGPFAPGTAEKQFRPMLDQQLADEVTSASTFGLVDTIVKELGSRLPAIQNEPFRAQGSTKDPFAHLNGAGTPINLARTNR